MKALILFFLMVTSVAFGKTNTPIIFPQVINLGYEIQIRIWNSTDKRITCMGPVYAYSETGKSDGMHFYGFVEPRMTSLRSFFPLLDGHRIINMTHSIACY